MRMNKSKFTPSVCLLLGVLSGYVSGHLVLMNGETVKELTPAEPHEVDSFIHTLRRYAEETLGSRKTREEELTLPTPNSSQPSVNSTIIGHESRNNSICKLRHNESESHDDLKWAKLQKYLNENDRPKLGFGSIVHDTLHSLLKSFENNSSRPAIFKTNFALMYADETND